LPDTPVRLAQLLPLIQERLDAGESVRITPHGISMRPMIVDGRDEVVLSPLPGKLRKYDLPLYRRDNGKFVLHRIIRVTPEGYLISGDNQYELEEVSRQQMLAVVSAFVRKGRSHTLREPGYRLYRWAWVKLFWLRKPYIKLRRKLGRIYHKLKHGR